MKPLVTKSVGFEWVVETNNKTGYASFKLGDAIDVAIPIAGGVNGTLGTVNIGYLRSYMQMGGARATCVAGCTCEPTDIWGSSNQRSSVTTVAKGIAIAEDPQSRGTAACIMRIDREYSGVPTYVDKHNKKIRHHFEVPPSEGEIGKFKVVGVVYTPPGSEIHAESMGMLKVLKEYS
eukprot:CAMPEP_0182897218 /NCGR_PEP_ID=MMETSP0034_2-20130328/26755_1 /TAXON_ID=156128 /ORGANISM="Nephroselmis pyriformis, Strain CCMP717" /LENGTH=176 /DNA_ID=CAMNT_0025031123 /DNA_START=5 /DNA_END=535 /DNA_ORIENTATION=-